MEPKDLEEENNLPIVAKNEPTDLAAILDEDNPDDERGAAVDLSEYYMEVSMLNQAMQQPSAVAKMEPEVCENTLAELAKVGGTGMATALEEEQVDVNFDFGDRQIGVAPGLKKISVRKDLIAGPRDEVESKLKVMDSVDQEIIMWSNKDRTEDTSANHKRNGKITDKYSKAKKPRLDCLATREKDADERSVSNVKVVSAENVVLEEEELDCFGENDLNAATATDNKCPLCPESMSVGWTLSAHMKAFHGITTKIHCDLCEFSSTSMDQVAIHAKVTHDSQPVFKSIRESTSLSREGTSSNKCPYCEFATLANSSLNLHIKTLHAKEFKCSMCPKAFASSSFLKRHVQVHERLKDFKCSQCPMFFSQSCDLEKHKEDHSPSNCPQCGKLCIFLDQHIKNAHPKKWNCQLCSFATNKSGGLLVHIQAIHEKVEDFKCSMCPMVFGENSDLQKHKVSTHMKMDHSKCHECGKICISEVSLNQHIEEAHGLEKHLEKAHVFSSNNQKVFAVHAKTKHRCNECPATFLKKSEVARHTIKEHTAEHDLFFKCPQCQMAFSERCDLEKHEEKAHVLSSNNQKEFAVPAQTKHRCHECPATFLEKSDVARHIIRVHAKAKHRCLECPATFLEKSSLTRHTIQVHNVWKCHLCNFTAKRSDTLTNHVRAFHKDEDSSGLQYYQCAKCGSSFTQKQNLVKHIRLVHNYEK
jgi:KRAB domain-containing zinc finger protein